MEDRNMRNDLTVCLKIFTLLGIVQLREMYGLTS